MSVFKKIIFFPGAQAVQKQFIGRLCTLMSWEVEAIFLSGLVALLTYGDSGAHSSPALGSYWLLQRSNQFTNLFPVLYGSWEILFCIVVTSSSTFSCRVVLYNIFAVSQDEKVRTFLEIEQPMIFKCWMFGALYILFFQTIFLQTKFEILHPIFPILLNRLYIAQALADIAEFGVRATHFYYLML